MLRLVILFFCSSVLTSFSQTDNKPDSPDVLSYEVVLELDITNKHIKGSVGITFLIDTAATTVDFSCGNLQLINVTGETVTGYEQKNKKVIISLRERIEIENQIQITYKGSPTKGIIFKP